VIRGIVLSDRLFARQIIIVSLSTEGACLKFVIFLDKFSPFKRFVIEAEIFLNERPAITLINSFLA